MRAFTKFLAAGVAIVAVASAAPAAAQYYPGYGYGNPYGGNVIGQVLNGVLGNGYGNYGAHSQVAVNQCAAAVQQRLNGAADARDVLATATPDGEEHAFGPQWPLSMRRTVRFLDRAMAS